MPQRPVRVGIFGSIVALFASSAPAADSLRIPLATGWAIQSSASVAAAGETLSRPGFATNGWHSARVPGTVVGALVEEGRYPDLFVGMNLRSLPGMTYPIGAQFSNLPMPADSPYKASWWYRKEFELPPAPANQQVWLNFNGWKRRSQRNVP